MWLENMSLLQQYCLGSRINRIMQLERVDAKAHWKNPFAPLLQKHMGKNFQSGMSNGKSAYPWGSEVP